MKILRNLLQHPLLENLDLDDPRTTEIRRQIILNKPFLKRIYVEWYELFPQHFSDIDGPILELGAGAGFSEVLSPQLIRSDIQTLTDINVVCDAHNLPFSSGTLRAILMINVLHHMHNPKIFFREAVRCLKHDGVIEMIEPWNSSWSNFVYRHFHHEAFEPVTSRWGFDSGGPLSGANGAIPWIIFSRERATFVLDNPQLSVEIVQPFMPFVYLLSGGVSMKSLMPEFTYTFLRKIGKTLDKNSGMFALIVVKKIAGST